MCRMWWRTSIIEIMLNKIKVLRAANVCVKVRNYRSDNDAQDLFMHIWFRFLSKILLFRLSIESQLLSKDFINLKLSKLFFFVWKAQFPSIKVVRISLYHCIEIILWTGGHIYFFIAAKNITVRFRSILS